MTKNKILAFLDDHIVVIVAVIVTVCAFIALSGCNGCKKPSPPIVNVVDVIEQSHNPKIDSLKKVAFLLIDSIAQLNIELVKQKRKTELAESKATATSKRLKDALNNKDTGSIIVYADDVIEEFNNYILENNHLDSIQDVTIEKMAATIENNRAEIELHESKYNLLKTAYQVKEIEANDWKEAANKLDRKLKKKKFWNGVWKIGTVAGAGLAAFVLL